LSFPYDMDNIRKIKNQLHEEGLPGSSLIGSEWQRYAAEVFEYYEWKDLDKNQKCALLKYRYFLIENKKRALSRNENDSCKKISEFILKNELYLIDLPEEYDVLESFIIKLAIKKEVGSEGPIEKTWDKRKSDRRRNPFLS